MMIFPVLLLSFLFLPFTSAQFGFNVTTAAPDPNLAVCSTALAVVSACEYLTPGFDDLDDEDAASCLCYDGVDNTSWDPLGFDDPWSSCVAYAQTADSDDYPSLSSAAGLCMSVGDILNDAAATTTDNGEATTTGQKQSATPGGGSGGGAVSVTAPAAGNGNQNGPTMTPTPLNSKPGPVVVTASVSQTKVRTGNASSLSADMELVLVSMFVLGMFCILTL